MDNIKKLLIDIKNNINWYSVLYITFICNIATIVNEFEWIDLSILNTCIIILILLAYFYKKYFYKKYTNKVVKDKVVKSKIKYLRECDLDIYDVWITGSGKLYIKLTENYSIAIGAKGSHSPSDNWGTLNSTQYVKCNRIPPFKKVGRIVFDDEK